LGKGGLFHQKLELNDTSQPRALRSLARIVAGGLCHRCGSCVGICPTSVLAVDEEGYPAVKNLNSCTDCDLCVKVCPGDEFNLFSLHQKNFPTAKLDASQTHGTFLEGIIAHATSPDIRERSTSGGLVTALLISLLERKEIDGALVIGCDSKELWRGRPLIARNKEELLSAMKSKYAIAPTNICLEEIRKNDGRYAVVGLPCQIHGIIKAKELDQRLKERIVFSIGLFCHAAIEHEAFRILWESLGEKSKQAKRFISRIGKHPGTPYLELEDGSLSPVYFPTLKENAYRPTSIEMINILYRLYTPSRCLTCFDASAEFADVAVGDPWMAPPEDNVNFYDGWSFALIRSERARQLVNDLTAQGDLGVVKLSERETLQCNTVMSTEKRWRAFRVIETHRRQGKAIPNYGFESPPHPVKESFKTELHMLSHIFCFTPKLRGRLLKFMLSKKGYYLLYLNHIRRKLRFYIRDTKEKVRRRLFGRE
jgi:coenzyme F420 hydrogenase subunit beta